MWILGNTLHPEPDTGQGKDGGPLCSKPCSVLFWEGRQTLGSSYVAEQEKGGWVLSSALWPQGRHSTAPRC